MPKFERSMSDPGMNTSHTPFDDMDSYYSAAPPKTPVHTPGTFIDVFSLNATIHRDLV